MEGGGMEVRMGLANDDGCLWESHCMAQHHLTNQFARHECQMMREYVSLLNDVKV